MIIISGVIDLAKYSLVLLDADGTLFDFDMAEGIALRKAFEHHSFQYSEDMRNIYREINSGLWKEFENGGVDKTTLQTRRFERLLEECRLDADACDFNSVYLDYLSEGGHLIDGALEVCRELSRHCTLAIVTNGISRTQRSRIGNSDIAPFIKHIIVSEDTGYQKPHPGFFHYTFDVCGHSDRKAAIIVGDSLSADMKGGENFGIATCWYNPDGTNERNGCCIDYEINNLSELLNIIL